MVAVEVSEHSSMSVEEMQRSLMDALAHLGERAAEAIDADENSERARDLAMQYQAISETILYLGSQLIAFEDIDAHLGDKFKN